MKLFNITLLAAGLFFIISTQAASLSDDKSTVLITGSNRGIGLEFVRHYVGEGWNVIATARSPDQATDLKEIAEDYENLIIEQLDVTDHARIEELGQQYTDTAIDILINNAGVLGSTDEQVLGSLDFESFEQIIAVNVSGPIKMIDVFHPHVAKSQEKKIVSITSTAGVLDGNMRGGGLYFYRISKTALNMAMRVAQADLKEQGIKVMPISPGVVDTDMLRSAFGTNDGPMPPGMPQPIAASESVAGMAKVIEAIDGSYDGSHMHYDGRVNPW